MDEWLKNPWVAIPFMLICLGFIIAGFWEVCRRPPRRTEETQ
jgi:hypothetical protein